MRHSVGGRERLAAVGSLLAGVAAFAFAIDLAVRAFPGGLIMLMLTLVAAGLAVVGLVNKGPLRVLAFCAAALALGIELGLWIDSGRLILLAGGVAVLLAGSFGLAQVAFRGKVPLPPAARPQRPVLFYNPKSGGGKAEEFNLAEEAENRGYRTVELTQGSDLKQLVRAEIDAGADALAMAGGDGSQAVVAELAAAHDLAYACIPAGTRNHFALDLGVDRDDCVGALDAFVEAGERLVDLAEVNGQVFVNNVSLGIYAEAVQKDEYRDAKVKTLLDTVPEVIGPEADGPEFDWHSPSGKSHHSAAAILVSNNQYRLGKALASGTRPKIDDGKLGIVVVADPAAAGYRMKRFQKPWREWSASSFEVGADEQVAAGIDGEAEILESPLRFSIRPGVLRVRIARQHPGASPSAAIPKGAVKVITGLIGIALGESLRTGMSDSDGVN